MSWLSSTPDLAGTLLDDPLFLWSVVGLVLGSVFLAVAWTWLSEATRRCTRATLHRLVCDHRACGLDDVRAIADTWDAACLTPDDVASCGVALWAVDLESELVVAAHGRPGLAAFGYGPDDPLDVVMRHDRQHPAWRWVRERFRSGHRHNLVILTDHAVTTFGVTPDDHPKKVVAASTPLAGVLDFRELP